MKVALLSLLLVLTCACIDSDWSLSRPFQVSSVSESFCTAFENITSALRAATGLQSAHVAFLSSARIPPWTVNTTLTLEADFNDIGVEGKLLVTGNLTLRNATLTSDFVTDYVFNVRGTLTLVHCTLRNFVSAPIYVGGQVTVLDSQIRENGEGVFKLVAWGGMLRVENTEFERNSATTGAVFFIYPASGNQLIQVLISKCQFRGNTAKEAGSVVSANDIGLTSPPTPLQVVFAECSFASHPTVPFQLTLSHSAFSLQHCQFTNETQVIVGTLVFTNLTLSDIEVTYSQGPLISLKMTGVVVVISSTFAHIWGGPVLAIAGESVASSFVSLSDLRLSNMTNMDVIIFGVLINAHFVSIQLSEVEIRSYQASTYGVCNIVSSVLYVTGLRVYNGTHRNALGMVCLSTVDMRDFIFDRLMCRSAVWVFFSVTGSITHITFTNILGFFIQNSSIYTTNILD